MSTQVDGQAAAQLDSKALAFQRGDIISHEALEAVAASADRLRAKIPDVLTLLRIPTKQGVVVAQAGDDVDGPPATLQAQVSTQYLRKVLSSIDVFKAFTPDEIDGIINAGRHETTPAGEAIFRQGHIGGQPALHIVYQGVARASRKISAEGGAKSNGSFVDRNNAKGGKRAGSMRIGAQVGALVEEDASEETLGYFDIGEFFGGSHLLDASEADRPRSVTVTAARTLKTLALTRADLSAYLPRLVNYLSRELAHRRWILQYRDRIAMDDLAPGRVVGVGTHGRVRHATHLTTGETYAVKAIDRRRITSSAELVEQAINERLLLSSCNHPFLMRLVAAHQSPLHLFYVLELALGGELYSLMVQRNKLDVPTARFYAANVCAAFAYLNTISLAYRDLKVRARARAHVHVHAAHLASRDHEGRACARACTAASPHCARRAVHAPPPSHLAHRTHATRVAPRSPRICSFARTATSRLSTLGTRRSSTSRTAPSPSVGRPSTCPRRSSASDRTTRPSTGGPSACSRTR